MPNFKDSKKSANIEEELTTTRKVVCQGSSNSHPKVYLFIKDTKINCPYCSKCFIFKGKD